MINFKRLKKITHPFIIHMAVAYMVASGVLTWWGGNRLNKFFHV